MTIDEAISHALEVAEQKEHDSITTTGDYELDIAMKEGCIQCAADHRQIAEWLTELKEAKGIIRVCNRVLGYLLECEIESTSTRHEVETLLKNITEYLSGGGENGS